MTDPDRLAQLDRVIPLLRAMIGILGDPLGVRRPKLAQLLAERDALRRRLTT